MYTCKCVEGFTDEYCKTGMSNRTNSIDNAMKTSEFIQQILTSNYECTEYAEWLSNVYWFRVGIITATSQQNVIHLSPKKRKLIKNHYCALSIIQYFLDVLHLMPYFYGPSNAPNIHFFHNNQLRL